MLIEKAKCPACTKKLPLLIFSAHRKKGGKGDDQFTSCPNCSTLIHAKSSEQHQKNFLWIFLFPLLATPVIFSLKALVPDNLVGGYFFISYALCFFLPTVKGQHKMEFSQSTEEKMKEILEAQPQENEHVKS